MLIQVNAADIESSDALVAHAREQVESSLKHVTDRVTRVEVHLHDDNSDKSASDDKRCVMEARIAGQQPLAVDQASDDLYKSISDAANKLGRAVTHKLEKLAAK